MAPEDCLRRLRDGDDGLLPALMWLLGSTANGDLKGLPSSSRIRSRSGMSGGSGAGDATSILNGGGKDLTSSSGPGQGRRRRVEAGATVREAKEQLRRSNRKEFERARRRR